uniref:Uncharacterized protein n=1 Tax=viral metagenome TaxID=1070528 RepID=A0A6H1ZDE5_9ZZZZ
MKIVFDTQENLSDSEIAIAAAWAGKHGFLVFLSEEPKESDLEALANMPTLTEEDMGKSPATRLRSVLYRYWEILQKPTQTFEEFYRMRMESLIELIKTKMN